MKKLFVILSAAALFTISGTAAQAKSFRVCNDTDLDVQFLKGEVTSNRSQGIQTAGWFKVKSNSCSTFNNVRGTKIYVYGKSAKRMFWRSGKLLCASSDSFEINNADTIACDQDKQSKKSFVVVNLNNGTTTYRFQQNNSHSIMYACNKSDAKIFTVYAVEGVNGAIETKGYYGVDANKCRGEYVKIANENFYIFATQGNDTWEGNDKNLCIVKGDAFNLQNAEHMACDQEKQIKRGFVKVARAEDGDFNVNFAPIKKMFKFCNTNDESILVMLAYKDGTDEFITSDGSYRVEENSCKEFNLDITLTEAYAYASTSLLKKTWSGDTKLCTDDGPFNYKNAETIECEEPSNSRRGFFKIEVEDGRASMTFGDDNAINSRSEVEFCNDMDEDVWMVIGSWDSAGIDQWTTKGWYKIDPMACRNFNDESSSKIMYSAFLSSDKSQVWAGEKMLCSKETDSFHIPKANKVACDKEGQKKLGYSSALLNAGNNTIRFSEENLNK